MRSHAQYLWDHSAVQRRTRVRYTPPSMLILIVSHSANYPLGGAGGVFAVSKRYSLNVYMPDPRFLRWIKCVSWMHKCVQSN